MVYWVNIREWLWCAIELTTGKDELSMYEEL